MHALRSYLTDYTITQNPIRNPLGPYRLFGIALGLLPPSGSFKTDFYVKWSICGGFWGYLNFQAKEIVTNEFMANF